MIGRDEALSILEAVLAGAKTPEAEALLFSGAHQLTRFASNGIHQNVAESNLTVRIRAIDGHRQGSATTNRMDEASLVEAASAASELAEFAAEDPDFPGLPEPSEAPEVDVFDDETAACEPQRRAEMARSIIDPAAKGEAVASGAVSTGAGQFAIANTKGLRAYTSGTSADVNTVIMAGAGSGARTENSWRLADLDAAAAGAAALGKCLDSREPVDIEPGEYTVILEEPAVGTIVDFLAYLGLGALAYQEGRSFLCGRLGDKMLGEKITIVDDALDPAGMPEAFDGEGTPKTRVVLFEKGVARNIVYDVKTAARDGVSSTGHGYPAPNTHGPFPGNMLVEPGDASVEDMIASTKKGLLVTRFHYTNVAEPSKAVITGMTRDGTFLVEDGRIVGAVRNLRFTESCVDALADVEMVGRERRRVGSNVVPALKLASFRFTGSTEF